LRPAAERGLLTPTLRGAAIHAFRAPRNAVTLVRFLALSTCAVDAVALLGVLATGRQQWAQLGWLPAATSPALALGPGWVQLALWAALGATLAAPLARGGLFDPAWLSEGPPGARGLSAGGRLLEALRLSLYAAGGLTLSRLIWTVGLRHGSRLDLVFAGAQLLSTLAVAVAASVVGAWAARLSSPAVVAPSRHREPRASQPPGTAPPRAAAPGACAACGATCREAICSACGALHAHGPYQVVALLSQRAGARSYLGAPAQGERVVIKELVVAQAPDATAPERFERAAALLEGLRHPRLPRLLEYTRVGAGPQQRLLTVLSYADGTPLDALVADAPQPAPLVEDVIRQVLDLLAFLQTRSPPLIHRDLTPANLVRGADGRVSLIGFGSEAGAPVEGTLTGTGGSVPPEQLAGRADLTSDVFALGLVAVQLLTGLRPVDLRGPTGAVSLPSALPVSSELAAVLRRFTAADPRARYPDARSARAAFQRAVAPAQTSPSASLALAGGAVAVLALSVLLARPSPSSPGPAAPLPGPAPAVAAPAAAAPAPAQAPHPGGNGGPTARIADVPPGVAGQQLSLDGSGSTDPDHDRLTYRWRLVSKPPASSARLIGDGPRAVLQPDALGSYLVELAVSDGQLMATAQTTLHAAEVTELPVRLVDALYSAGLASLIIAADGPARLIRQSPRGGTSVEVALPRPPRCLGLSLDGQRAAVGHDGAVSIVDLRSAQVIDTFKVPVVVEAVALVDGWAYAFAQGAHGVYAIDLASGALASGSYSNWLFSPSLQSTRRAYGATRNVSPGDLVRVDFDGPKATVRDSRYHGDYPICDRAWLSPSAPRAYTGCGAMFHLSGNFDQDMTYEGTLPGGQYYGLSELPSGNVVAVVGSLMPTWWQQERGVLSVVEVDPAALAVRHASRLPPSAATAMPRLLFVESGVIHVLLQTGTGVLWVRQELWGG